MIALRVASVIFFAIGGAWLSPSSANELLETICDFSGKDQQKITDELRGTFIGSSTKTVVQNFEYKWTIVDLKTPKTLYGPNFRRYENSENLSFIAAKTECFGLKIGTDFFVALESRDGKVVNIDTEIYYSDEDFSLRGENLFWRRYQRKSDLFSALNSLNAKRLSQADWSSILQNAGYVRNRKCESKNFGNIFFDIPLSADRSISQKLGADFTPNSRRRVVVSQDGSASIKSKHCR